MPDFSSWCDPETVAPVGRHAAGALVSNDDETGIDAVAATLPDKYAATEPLARIADRHGKKGVSELLRKKLPTKKSARSGDMGEILATAYLEENMDYVVGPSRLIHRDHQEWAMRGDDVLGVRLDDAELKLVKVEAKSQAKAGEAVVSEARAGLGREEGLPSSHSLTQFAERLLSTADDELGDLIMDLQIGAGVRPSQVTHVMFLFTGNDPSEHVRADLSAYQGPMAQRTVILRVAAHQDFIRESFDRALDDGA